MTSIDIFGETFAVFFHKSSDNGPNMQVQDDQPGWGWHLRLGLPRVQPREQGEGGCNRLSALYIIMDSKLEYYSLPIGEQGEGGCKGP